MPLNSSQQRSIVCGFLDIHRRMGEIEALMKQDHAESPFSEYADDLTLPERRTVEEHFAKLRATMLHCMQDAAIPPDVPRTSLRWKIQCTLTFLHIAVLEMSPERLRAYGPVDPAAENQIKQIQQDLNRLIQGIGAALRQSVAGQ
jgi:hypothetical protein